MGKLKLTVNEEKTRICKVPEGEFDFLGYTFGRMYSARTGQARIGYRPSKKGSCLGRLPGAPGRSSRSLSAAQAQSRFQLTMRRFIGVFARPEQPLALFLDDLQWLDAATLDLIEDVLTQADVRDLMLIGAYRDNEVDAAHPLARKLAAIRSSVAKVSEIKLAPLQLEHVRQLIVDALHCDPVWAEPLIRARATGETYEIDPFRGSASSSPTIRKASRLPSSRLNVT
jgi:hypothetical protein